MMDKNIFLFLVVLIFLFVGFIGSVNAANHYVKQEAAGSGTGADWANAYTSLPSNLARGDTYYIADGSYGSYIFDDPESGTQYITIKKATESDHGTSTGWDDAYGDGQALFGNLVFSRDNFIIDGQVGGGPSSWETGHGFKVKSGSHNIELSGSRSNIGLYHIDIENNGKNTHNTHEHSIYAIGGITNFTVAYCYLHDVSVTMLISRGGSGILLEYNKFARNGDIGDSIHREAWSGNGEDNVIIRYNIFEDISNTAYIAQVNGNDSLENWDIYGNVFWMTPSSPDSVSAILELDSIHVGNNFKIYNNVITNIKGLNAGFSFCGGSSNVQIYNNIWYNNSVNSIGSGTDYNWYYNNIRTSGCSPPCNLDQPRVDSEAHGQLGIADPFVDWQSGNFHLTSPTNHGMTLSSPYNIDPDGNLRGADRVWDIGAYEYVSGTVSTCGPADDDSNGIVSTDELIDYISEWKSGNVTIGKLIAAIAEWKNGC